MNAVSDTGPLLHLSEIKALNLARIFRKVFVPPEVARELAWTKMPRFAAEKKLGVAHGKKAIQIVERFRLDLGESEALALATQLKINTLLTDDLDARDAAKQIGLEPVGTVGIIISAYKKNLLQKSKCIDLIKKTKSHSSLFITEDLIEYAIKKINNA